MPCDSDLPGVICIGFTRKRGVLETGVGSQTFGFGWADHVSGGISPIAFEFRQNCFDKNRFAMVPVISTSLGESGVRIVREVITLTCYFGYNFFLPHF